MKIDKEIVESVLARYNNIGLETRKQIIYDIEQEINDNKTEPEKRGKKEYVIIATNNSNDIEEVLNSTPLYIIQVEEGDDHTTIVERITTASAEYNNTTKGSKFPVKTVGEAMEQTKRKLLSEKGLWVKTKEPVIVVATNNELQFQ